jgi:hypothetical protein
MWFKLRLYWDGHLHFLSFSQILSNVHVIRVLLYVWSRYMIYNMYFNNFTHMLIFIALYSGKNTHFCNYNIYNFQFDPSWFRLVMSGSKQSINTFVVSTKIAYHCIMCALAWHQKILHHNIRNLRGTWKDALYIRVDGTTNYEDLSKHWNTHFILYIQWYTYIWNSMWYYIAICYDSNINHAFSVLLNT